MEDTTLRFVTMDMLMDVKNKRQDHSKAIACFFVTLEELEVTMNICTNSKQIIVTNTDPLSSFCISSLFNIFCIDLELHSSKTMASKAKSLMR